MKNKIKSYYNTTRKYLRGIKADAINKISGVDYFVEECQRLEDAVERLEGALSLEKAWRDHYERRLAARTAEYDALSFRNRNYTGLIKYLLRLTATVGVFVAAVVLACYTLLLVAV
jgi:hypothetical protein